MRNAKNYRNNVFRLNRLYAELAITDKKQKSRVRETVRKILTSYKGEGYIKDFRVRTEGRESTAIEIEL